MIWEGRIVSAGNWVECKISVAAAAGAAFSWVGQLKMRPEEWRDFHQRMNLSEVSESLWTSSAPPVPLAPQA
jgi:hypothetical protein